MRGLGETMLLSHVVAMSACAAWFGILFALLVKCLYRAGSATTVLLGAYYRARARASAGSCIIAAVTFWDLLDDVTTGLWSIEPHIVTVGVLLLLWGMHGIAKFDVPMAVALQNHLDPPPACRACGRRMEPEAQEEITTQEAPS